MKTLENNKLIAEFMGKQLPYINSKGDWEFMVEGAGLISSPRIEDLNRFLGYNYHKDWTWLMDVVERIEETEVDNNILMLESIGNMAKFIFDDGCRFLNDCIGETKIEAVYNACVDFIEWYKQNNPEHK